MEGLRHDDPFMWDVETVAESLCNLERPCTHDPAALAERIKQEGIDGHTLLTFEFVCSRPELFDSLGIKLGAHKASLGRAILGFRALSQAFRQWKLDLIKEQSEEVAALQGPLPDPIAVLPLEQSAAMTTPPESDTHPPGQHTSLSETDANPSGRYTSVSETNANPPGQQSGEMQSSPPDPDERPAKRKRLAPTHLTSKPVNPFPVPQPTEADGIRDPAGVDTIQEGAGWLSWEQAPPHAYLGRGVIPISAFKSTTPLTTQVVEDKDTFATSFPVRLPAGLRLTASRVMKRHLVSSGRKETLLRQGIHAMESSSDTDDEVLDLLDLPDSPDEQTLREIEIEEAEAEQEEALRSERVSPKRAHALLQEAVDAMKAHWELAKLPRHQRRAWKLWTDARRRGTKTRQVLYARQLAKAIDHRLRKLWTEITEQPWAKEADICNQARSLEQSVEDKLYNTWLATTLDSRIEPPKPDKLTKPVPSAAKKLKSSADSEVLTSSDEEDFIVPDPEPEEAMDMDHAPSDDGQVSVKLCDEPVSRAESTPMKAEPFFNPASPMFVDLTQLETPQSSRSVLRHVPLVDLTTPCKPRRLFQPASGQSEIGSTAALATASQNDEGFENIEEIGKKPTKHWVELKDRSRLVICLLWNLPHARRTRVFEAARDHNSDELFNFSVGHHLSEPLQDAELLRAGGPKVLPFDMNHLFLSYIKVNRVKLSRVLKISASSRKKIAEARGKTWNEFQAFLKRIEPEFPQDSQIYRADAYDEPEQDALLDAQETHSKSRKNVEIVQNKDAVDLRERENRRLEEQEARRIKLRADLNTSGFMPRDKSRLIINETKQEDQPFIYINEETGKRIKDHQIDGVRFLWNQIVLDKELRQGCLLSHAMGLGKTMQVITFLLAIQESVKSSDPAVTAQIPEDLRESKTLILCPAGLVDNWMDELLLWAPEGLFGPLRKLDSLLPKEERPHMMQAWAREGGILVIGYNMLRQVMDVDENTECSLLTEPNIVVADEAHVLKDTSAKLHRICSRIKTSSRIALTGSPLANNVVEYYNMINWVAPNFLGPEDEFKQIYAQPIQQGLWGDSKGWEKRRALKMLRVLTETVAPKVHRRTIKALKKDLPPKREFVIIFPPTKMQRRLYDMYVMGNCGGRRGSESFPQAQLFSFIEDLRVLCNHPRCFHEKMLHRRPKTWNENTKNKPKPEADTVPESVITSVLKETNSAQDLDDAGLSLKIQLLGLILDEAREVGEKVLVFSQSRLTLDYLLNQFKMQKRRVCLLNGSTAVAKRQDLIKNFNAGSQEVYLISTTAGGVGLNIHGASRVVIMDFKWNPIHEQQAIGRAYRIGQEKPVFVYWFVMEGTFEEDLQNKTVFKMQMASRVVDEQNPVSWSKRSSSLFHTIRLGPAKGLDEFVGKDRVLDKLIKYKDNGEAIRSIVSTDTFEEEDPDVDLTAEERRYAEDMVKLNRLRATDPVEYDRQMSRLQAAELSRQLLEQHQTSYEEPVGPNRQHDQLGGPRPLAMTEVPASTQSLAIRAAVAGSPGAPVSSAMPSGTLKEPTRQSNSAVAEQRQAAMQLGSTVGNSVHAPTSMKPLPKAGANTYFGNEAPPMLGAPRTQAAVQTAVQTTVTTPVQAATVPGPKLFTNSKKDELRDACEQKLRRWAELLPTVGSTASSKPWGQTARDITLSIARIQDENRSGFLHDNMRWRLLEKHLHDDERFAQAVLVGHITPSFLALTSNTELESRVSVLKSLAARVPEPRDGVWRKFGPSSMTLRANFPRRCLLALGRATLADIKFQEPPQPAT